MSSASAAIVPLAALARELDTRRMGPRTATPAEVRQDASFWSGREVIAVFRARPTAGAERGSPVSADRHQLEGVLRIEAGAFFVGADRLDEQDEIEQFQLVR